MSQPHQVIMYRNPMEYAIWNGSDGATLFPIMVSAAVAIATVVVAGKVHNYLSQFFTGNRFRRNKARNTALSVIWYDLTRHIGECWPLYAGAIAAVVTFNAMAL